MGLICWDKPKKLRTAEKHNATYSSDSGVNGTYVPNMSEKDRRKWKGKITQVTTSPQVEIRKDSFVVVVGLDGYTYKYYRRIPKDGRGGSTKGLNIHIAAAGPIQMSFKVWEEFMDVVREARQALEELKRVTEELTKKLKEEGERCKAMHNGSQCILKAPHPQMPHSKQPHRGCRFTWESKHSFNKKKICIKCGMSSTYARAFNRPCSEEGL